MKFARLLALGFGLVASRSFAEPLISFDEAVRQMLARSTQVRLTIAAREGTLGKNMASRFSFLPRMSLEGQEGKNSPGSTVSAVTGVAQLNLFKFGADMAALDAARASERAADFSIQQSLLQEERSAIVALVAWIRLQQESEILAKLAQLQSDSVDVATRQYKGGRVPLQEVQKATVDLENVRARIGESTLNLQTAQLEVVRLLGHADIKTGWPWKEKIKTFAVPEALDAKDFFNLRPDYREASERFEAQDRLSARALRSMLPELNAKFGYGYTRDTSVSSQYLKGWNAFLLLEIPLFSRFEDYSNYRFQLANREAADISRTEVLRKIQADFNTLPKQFLVSRQTALARENLLQVSGHLYQDNLSRFKLGRASSNELSIDLNRFLQTELNEISGWALAHLSYMDLAHSMAKSAL